MRRLLEFARVWERNNYLVIAFCGAIVTVSLLRLFYRTANDFECVLFGTSGSLCFVAIFNWFRARYSR